MGTPVASAVERPVRDREVGSAILPRGTCLLVAYRHGPCPKDVFDVGHAGYAVLVLPRPTSKYFLGVISEEQGFRPSGNAAQFEMLGTVNPPSSRRVQASDLPWPLSVRGAARGPKHPILFLVGTAG